MFKLRNVLPFKFKIIFIFILSKLKFITLIMNHNQKQQVQWATQNKTNKGLKILNNFDNDFF